MLYKHDFYKLLGVGEDASQKDIVNAYRKVALKHHPDKNHGSVESTKLFQEIQHAHTVWKHSC